MMLKLIIKDLSNKLENHIQEKGGFIHVDSKMRDQYVCAITFNDFPNVIHLARFMMDSKVVSLKIPLSHPRTKEMVFVHYRGTSKSGRKIYFFKEGNSGGSILAG